MAPIASQGAARSTATWRGRLRAQLGLKIAVLLGLSVGICLPYFLLQHVDVFPLRTPPVTPLDRWIVFDPGWIWPYLSIALLVPLAPLVATSQAELLRYGKGLALLALPCFAIFLLFPVEGPRPGPPPAHEMYRLIVDYDRPSNSFPSLHAGLAIYSLLFGYRVLRDALDARGRMVYAVAGALWASTILYSTMATKQHWALDLPPGALAAAAAQWLAWWDVDRAQTSERVELTPGRGSAR